MKMVHGFLGGRDSFGVRRPPLPASVTGDLTSSLGLSLPPSLSVFPRLSAADTDAGTADSGFGVSAFSRSAFSARSRSFRSFFSFFLAFSRSAFSALPAPLSLALVGLSGAGLSLPLPLAAGGGEVALDWGARFAR